MEKNKNLFTKVTEFRYAGKFESALHLIETQLSNGNLSREEKIQSMILKGSILNAMGVYQESKAMLEELIEEISTSNQPVYLLEANILKIDSLQNLSQREQCFRLITQMEDFLAINKEIHSKKREEINATLLYQKGEHFWRIGKPKTALKHLNNSLTIVKKIENQELLGMVFNRIGCVYGYTGTLDKSLAHFKKNFEIQAKIMNKHGLSVAYNNIGDSTFQKGEYDIALDCFESCVKLGKDIGNKTALGVFTLNLGMINLYLGNFEKALESLKEALILNNEAHNENPTSSSLHFLIQLLLEIQAPKTEVNYYLTKLERLHQTSKSNFVRDRYLVTKGLVLKSSNRLTEKVEAQKYFKQVINSKSARFDMYSKAVLNSIELLILELKSTESIEVLEEIEDLTNSLLIIGKQKKIAPILTQTFILQSKIALLQLEIDQAKELLNKAGELANKKNLRKLSIAIMKEQKELYKKLNAWESLTDKKISFRERVELAKIEDTLEKITSNRLELVDDIENLSKEFSIDKLSLVVFRFGSSGAEFYKGIDLPKSESIERDLFFMSATFMTVLGQGENYHMGLFGPLPAPIKDYVAIIYSLMMNDRNQTDSRLKGQTYTLFCILYPPHFSSMLYKRTAITNIFETKTSELKDLADLTKDFLLELRQEVYQKITEIFTPTSIFSTADKVNFNIKSQ